jgi:hypothetical protein
VQDSSWVCFSDSGTAHFFRNILYRLIVLVSHSIIAGEEQDVCVCTLTMKKTTSPTDLYDDNNNENEDYSSVAEDDSSNGGSFGADEDDGHDSTQQQQANKTNHKTQEAAAATADADTPEPIAKNETSTVRSLKLLVLAVLVLAMVTITVGVYLFTAMEEEHDFEDSIADYTVKISASLGENIDLTLGAVDAFAVTLISFAAATNQTWPFVTIPDFAVRGAKIRSLSSAVVLILYQNVAHEQRAA